MFTSLSWAMTFWEPATANTLPVWFHWILTTYMPVSIKTGSSPKQGINGKTFSRGTFYNLKHNFLKYFFNSAHLKKKEKLHTLVILMSHDLASPIVKADGKAGAIWLHVTLCTMVPMNPSNADGSSDVH